ncbi:hypothetical protein M8C21_006213 [Ambrosia artemisiifolia]|uniref:Uncharacterized protein n=1 Tax=Ambrosia artemisiifolia TaxID=4212 RepID=A0AAD5GF25_AMBAR|nr:hypothetical protein M8C21_006213 [Ambrosia artemisiifolia]
MQPSSPAMLRLLYVGFDVWSTEAVVAVGVVQVNLSVFESYCCHLEREVSVGGGYHIEKTLRCAEEIKLPQTEESNSYWVHDFTFESCIDKSLNYCWRRIDCYTTTEISLQWQAGESPAKNVSFPYAEAIRVLTAKSIVNGILGPESSLGLIFVGKKVNIRVDYVRVQQFKGSNSRLLNEEYKL